MKITKNAAEVLARLTDSGYEAYLAGGCVRDSIMGRPIHDFDITTSARPEQIVEVFGTENTVPTGLAHGTVTVLHGGESFEVTTYRIDGEYSDMRRPDSVRFTSELTEDLARRDFTINAMAMSADGQIIDPFGGREDISRGVIRCVGDPEVRFGEDALRIMRAVRFAAQLGFTIEPNTENAVHGMKSLLKSISPERIHDELDKLICGEDCVPILLGYSDVITEIIPEFKPCIGFDQKSKYHKYTVWEHIVRAVDSAPADHLKLRRTLLFHDIGKPACAYFDEKGVGHFKGHDGVGAEMTRDIMRRLHYDNVSISYAAELISRHSTDIFNIVDVKKMMSDIGDELFFELMLMKKCDNTAKNEFVLEENDLFDELIRQGHKIVESDECRSLKQLKIDGNDLSALGLSGKDIGIALDKILMLVIEDKLENDCGSLMQFARQRWGK